MTRATIWHNPRCSKSREALALLEGRGVTVTPRLYLEDPPDAETLRAVLKKLGRIADAQHVPLNELKDRLDEIPRDRPVIPVCHAGMRSGQATVILRQAGFPRVANLRGGMLSWQQLGLPVVRGANSPA